MNIKLIAIGNRLMGDDAVAINVAEQLSLKLKELGIKVIIGETDFEYCLSVIENHDSIILLDSTFFGITPGTITIMSIKEALRLNINKSQFSQHGYSLFNNLGIFYPKMDIKVIGIEGSTFNFTLSLSDMLKKQLENITKKVEKVCSDLIKI